MKWTSLEAWAKLDRDVKERAAKFGEGIHFRGIAPNAVGDWLTSQVCATLAVPVLATPIVTWLLYPWLPQPDAWLYVVAGLMLLGMSLVARHEYKKKNLEALVVSDHSHAVRLGTNNVRDGPHDDQEPGSPTR